MTTTVLQRLIFPHDADPDVLPLYLEGAPGRAEFENPVKMKGDLRAVTYPEAAEVSRIDRYSCALSAGSRTSFATYMNAFPASYWASYTTISTVTCRVVLSGSGSVLINRSNARGHCYRIDSTSFEGSNVTVTFTLPLNTFNDGGWYWFDIVAHSDVTVESAQFETDDELPRPDKKATVAICTFNRVDDCVEVLHQLGRSDILSEYVAEVVVVDQGSDKIRNHPEFAQAEENLGGLLRVEEQGNLGGSGGFSRGMAEAVVNGSEYVVLLDDDVRVDPEGICRGVTFANATTDRTIVGGHMFSMYERTKLHAMAESVELNSFWWGPTLGTETGHDFSRMSLRQTPWLHERAEANYNGWWMCLIPTSLIREIGMSLPLFIKWDDSEFGLRAREHGVGTVSLPGMALWHVPWTAKEDSLDWQAYFHERNRLIAALLHSPHPDGGGVVKASFVGTVKHLVSAQYSVAALRDLAIRDIMSGPDSLHAELGTKVSQVRDIRSAFTDAQVKPDRSAFPSSDMGMLPNEVVRRRGGFNPLKKAVIGVNAIRKQFRGARPSASERPQIDIPFAAARWWTIAQYDSALVSNSDGSGYSFYKRDPEFFITNLKATWALHQELKDSWAELAEQYRTALPKITGIDQWADTWGVPELVEAWTSSKVTN